MINNYMKRINNNKVVSHTYDFIGSNINNIGIQDEVVTIDTGIQAEELTLNEPITYDSFEYAPYINTEWYNPIHHINDDVIIQYYVTDRNQEDYFKGVYTKHFLVIIDFNGKVFRRKVKAGNHKINLGKPSALGENYFSIQCIDLYNNYESCIHYKHLKVIDDNYTIQDNQVYTMSEEDLITYNIVISIGDKVSDEIGASNIEGINSLLTDVRSNGYRKIIFYNPNGDTDTRYIYYLQPYNSKNNPIIIPNGLTVDLNKCKWKQLVSYGSSSLLVSFEQDSEDCHLINGYVWGDYDEHIVNKNDPNYPGTTTGIEGEGYNLISLAGAYNSIENLDAGWCTGYSICAGGNKSYLGNAINSFTNGYVDRAGLDCISDEDIWTCDYQELTDNMKRFKYLQANPYGGYSGLCGKVNDEIVIYYDKNKNFIKREKIRQYGLSLIPSNASYVRFTLCSDTKANIENVTAPGFRIETRNYKPSTCWLSKNNYIHDCRTVAFAIGIYNHFTIDSDLIEGCGQWLGPNNGQVTALAIDVEDGYQHSEALYIKNLICQPSPTHSLGSVTVNLVTTYDVHMYGVNECCLCANKTFGLSLHNVEILKGLYVGRQSHKVTGFMMVYNCIINMDTIFNCTTDLSHPNTQINNCVIIGQVNTYNTNDTSRIFFKNCDITRQPRGNIFVGSEHHINCIIRVINKHYLNGSSVYQNCTIITDNNSYIGLNSGTEQCKFINCDLNVKYSRPSQSLTTGYLWFMQCKFLNDTFDSNDEAVIKINCKTTE